MDRWKFVNEKWIPRHLPHAGKALYRGYRCSRIVSLPHWGRGTASAVDRVLSQTAYLRRSPSLSFIPLEPYPARFACHLPHAGKALCREYRFPHPTSAPSGHLLPEEGGSVHTSPFLWKGLPSAARRGWLSFLRRSRLLFAFPMQGKLCYPCAILHNQHCPYEGKPKRRRKHPAPL